MQVRLKDLLSKLSLSILLYSSHNRTNTNKLSKGTIKINIISPHKLTTIKISQVNNLTPM